MANYTAASEIAYALKAEIRLSSGAIIHISEDDISSYAPNTTMSNASIPLGSAAATSFSMTFNNQEYALTAMDLDGAEVRGYASEGTDGVWKDFGVWFVEGADISEQDAFATISGSDALNSKFNIKWADVKEDYPRNLLLIVKTMCVIAGIELATTDFRNATYTVTKMPEWGEEATIRDVISHVAVCAAGFARINYSGQLEIKTIGETVRHTANADYYSRYTAGGRFDFNCLQYQFETDNDDEEPEYTRYAIDTEKVDNATNTIQLNGNPLMTDAMANNIAMALANISYEGASITWFGGVDVLAGDELAITTLDGATHILILNNYSLSMTGGISSEAACDMPSVISETGFFSNGTSAFNPNGTINAGAISGLNKKVISAEIAYLANLTSESIGTSKLVSNWIETIRLKATSISTNSIETDILTAAVAEIVKATIRKITAETIKTDELSAAMAEIVGLKVSSLTAADITTDRLASALAAFTVLTAGTADFDRATVEHLVSKALNLEFGTADEVFIRNLRVGYAQMVSATIGNLVIQASDGNYYRIDVNAGGNVSAEPVSLTDGEIAAGQTDSGRVILATDITADSLNTSNLLATYALINQIDAARIDVDQLFAREAFIAKLLTTDISSNSYIQQTITGEVEKFARLDEQGLHIGQKDADSELLLDEKSMAVRQNGRAYSKFASNFVQFGKYQLRRSADGGLVFKLTEG